MWHSSGTPSSVTYRSVKASRTQAALSKIEMLRKFKRNRILKIKLTWTGTLTS